MSRTKKNSLLLPFELQNFDAFNLIVESKALRGNPLGDPSTRHNYILVPKNSEGPLPLVFHLSGYFSTGYQNFTSKTLQSNFVQKLDQTLTLKKSPQAVHVFVEATTYWGGSQFINSPGCGEYEDYLLNDLYLAVCKEFEIDPKRQCVLGGSSGGYGALHLISVKESPFNIAFAAAPDSFFEGSLWPELLQAAPQILKFKNLKDIKKKIDDEELQDKKSFFNLANVIAMAHCYSPKNSIDKNKIEWPIDLYSGETKKDVWRRWKRHDPIEFLKKREKYLKNKEIHLDVGLYDNFHLQYGTRQIYSKLKSMKVKCELTEFSGNHFGLSVRKLLFLDKLAKRWA